MNWTLFYFLLYREVFVRYKGTILGPIWAIFSPLILVTIYTFIFTEIFDPRWSFSVEGKASYALNFFIGLIIFNFFSESITNSSMVIMQNINYVKKVIFPIELLPLTVSISSLLNFFINIMVLVLFLNALKIDFSFNVLQILIISLAFAFFVLGFSFFIAALSVFFRDINHLIKFAIMMIMFLSPILYPVSALPLKFQKLIYLNPLSFPIESFRNLVFLNTVPSFKILVMYSVISIFFSILGFYFFKKAKCEFAEYI